MWKALSCALLVATPALAMAADSKQSEDLAQQAYEAYSKGDYQQALALYKKAYQASPAAVILFNIANIYDKKLKDREQAAEHYNKYLRSGDTEPDLVKRANERLEAMKTEKEPAKPPPAPTTSPAPPPPEPIVKTAPAPQPPPPPSDEDRGATLRTLGIVTGALGFVGIGIGSVFGLMAKSKNDDAAALCNGNACTDPSALTLTEDARSNAQLSTVSFLAGGALLVSGVVMFALAPRAEKRTGVRLAPSVGGLTVWGTWQ